MKCSDYSTAGCCRRSTTQKVGLLLLSLPIFVNTVVNFLLPSPLAMAQGQGKSATSLCAELIRPIGYTCIEYEVTTSDGFILGVQNVPFSQGVGSSIEERPTVILQHGVLAAGETWVLNQPDQSLAFILADAGFDVWIANSRNVQWSHGHVTYTPSDDGYWNWTSDQLASFDLEATIKFVYDKVGGNKIQFVAHSEGTLLLLAGLTGGAYKNEILSYLKSAVLLAPVAFVGNFTAPITKAGLSIYGDVILPAIGIRQLNPNAFVNLACTLVLIGTVACDNILTGLLGSNSYLNQTRLPYYTNYYPQPTSSLNFNQFGQSYRTYSFSFYDWGPAGNLAEYGQSTPPIYDLTSFPTSLPLQIWTGGIDQLADPMDVAALLEKLPSSNREVINLPDYGHLDSLLGYRAGLDIYPGVIQFLRAH